MYAQVEDMVNRYGRGELVQLTDRGDEVTGEINTTVIATALVDAAETINSYVAARYSVPLTPVPEPAKRWACSLAYYYLHRFGVPDDVRTAYADTIAALKDVAKGIMVLQSAGVATAAPVGDTFLQVHTTGASRVFSNETLKGF